MVVLASGVSVSVFLGKKMIGGKCADWTRLDWTSRSLELLWTLGLCCRQTLPPEPYRIKHRSSTTRIKQTKWRGWRYQKRARYGDGQAENLCEEQELIE